MINPKSKRTKKRSYVSKACDFCKQKHLKCDGANPCFQCTKRKNICSYAKHNKQRGPKPQTVKVIRRNFDEPRAISASLSSELPRVSSRQLKSTQSADGLKNYHLMMVKEEMAEWSDSLDSSGFASFEELDLSNGLEGSFGLMDSWSVESSYGSMEGSYRDDVTYQGVVDALAAFEYRLSAFYPNSFFLEHQKGYDVAIAAVMGNFCGDQCCFMYVTVLAQGFRMIGDENLSHRFASLAYDVFKKIFYSDRDLDMNGTANVFVSTLSLLVDIIMQNGQFKRARRVILEAYDIADSHVDEVHPMVLHRIYSYMAGIARTQRDRLHWVQNAIEIPAEYSTPINHVFLCFFHCSPGLARSKTGHIFPDDLNFPENRNSLESDQLFHFQKMITQLMRAEEFVQHYQNSHHGDTLVIEYANSCHLVIYACRAIIFAQSGNRNNAYTCSAKTLEYASILSGEIVYPLIPIAIAYALKVLAAVGYFPMFESGMKWLEMYSGCYPVCKQLIQHLKLENNKTTFDFSRI